jgi:hypothetical protein
MRPRTTLDVAREASAAAAPLTRRDALLLAIRAAGGAAERRGRGRHAGPLPWA